MKTNFSIVSLLSILLSSSVTTLFYNQNNSVTDDTKVSHATLINGVNEDEYYMLVGKNTTKVIQDNYYASYYFKNLCTNFGNNLYGTCTYVALGMLLSFYDSYWDDSVIEEKYDVNSSFTSISQIDDNFDLIPFSADSPGITYEGKEYIGNLSIAEYYSAIDFFADNFFQLKLLQLSKSYFGSIKFDTSYSSLGMTQSEMVEFLEYYLYDYAHYTINDFNIVTKTGANLQTREFLKSCISQGIPVILRNDVLNGHAFVAYDYDEKTDEVYVHGGLKKQEDNTILNHVALGKLSSMPIWDVTAIEVKKEHNHSNNYISNSDNSLCSCNYIYPREIELVSSACYRDIPPSFKWKSLYQEKWHSFDDVFFELSTLNYDKNQILDNIRVNQKEYTLTMEEWDKTLFNSSDEGYYIYLNLNSSSDAYLDDYWSMSLFDNPREYKNLPIIRPSEYGFADAYPIDGNTKTIFTSHVASNGFKFETRRYRTGYIHNEYIVMSSKRININEAFIEYRFETAVTRIDVELSHWRGFDYEFLDSTTGTAEIQQFIDKSWETKLDLLAPATHLPTDRTSPKIYSIFFDQPAYRIRFYSSTLNDNENDSNRARICIGNIAFYLSEYSLPPSGYELDYTPEDWVLERDTTNCYAYVLNKPSIGIASPGNSQGYDPYNLNNYFTKEVLEEMVSLDKAAYNFEFEPIGKYEKCLDNYYKVALVVDSNPTNSDYHWYRQNSDGTWSHKITSTPASKYDHNEEIIFDPENCDRRTLSNNYTQFIGFYQICLTD